MLKAVTAEPGHNEQTFNRLRRADDRHGVRGHLVKPSPRVHNPGVSEDRQPIDCCSCDLLEKLPTDSEVVACRLVRIGHPKKNACAFTMKIERALEIYNHYARVRRARNGCDWFSDEDVAAIRKDRDVDAGHTPDLAGMRAGCVDNRTSRDLASCCLNRSDPTAFNSDSGHCGFAINLGAFLL